MVLGSLYRPPNTNEDQFISNIHGIVTKIHQSRPNHELVLGMDHNMDLLKSIHHKPTHAFLDTLTNSNLLPTITRPSCITLTSVTLINNIFISEGLHRQFESTILLEDISDHLPLVAMLKQTKILSKTPLPY